MLRILSRAPALALLLAVPALSGCDALEDVFGGENEITGLVETVGADFLTVDATRYSVTAGTEYEGYTRLSDISVGDEVGVAYEDRSGARVAVEIEDAANETED